VDVIFKVPFNNNTKEISAHFFTGLRRKGGVMGQGREEGS
jgi:hypothetical protein